MSITSVAFMVLKMTTKSHLDSKYEAGFQVSRILETPTNCYLDGGKVNGDAYL